MKFNNIVVTYYPKYQRTAENICEHLKQEYKIESSCHDIEPIKKPVDGKFDLIISVGGDGTFIKSASMYRAKVILGVKASDSSVGYHCSSNKDNYEKHLKLTISGNFKTKQYFSLKTLVGDIELPHAFNEVLLMRRNVGEMFNFHLEFDNKSFGGRSTSVIVYTPAGSTAHAKSAGGAQIQMDSDMIGIVPESQFSGDLRNPIFSSEKEIIVKSKDPGTVIIDGWYRHNIDSNDEIRVSKGRKIEVIGFD
jgi:NAD+ kinase